MVCLTDGIHIRGPKATRHGHEEFVVIGKMAIQLQSCFIDH